MSKLVAFYDEKPVEVRGRVEVDQSPRSSAPAVRTLAGVIQSAMVYVVAPAAGEQLLVPFAEFDDWSLRDRYNEALRIMSTLGASSIVCESYGETSVRRSLRAALPGKFGEVSQQRIKRSGFDYQSSGDGSTPRDPRPLRWPDEPGFAAAVTSVLDNGATEVFINIHVDRTHSVDGALGIALKDLGFNLGGTSQRSGETTLKIRATFPERAKGWRSRK